MCRIGNGLIKVVRCDKFFYFGLVNIREITIEVTSDYNIVNIDTISTIKTFFDKNKKELFALGGL